MAAYTKSQQLKKERSGRLGRERDQSSLLSLDLKDSKLQDSGNQEGACATNCMKTCDVEVCVTQVIGSLLWEEIETRNEMITVTSK